MDLCGGEQIDTSARVVKVTGKGQCKGLEPALQILRDTTTPTVIKYGAL